MKKIIALILLSMVIAGCATSSPKKCSESEDEEQCLYIRMRGWNRP